MATRSNTRTNSTAKKTNMRKTTVNDSAENVVENQEEPVVEVVKEAELLDTDEIEVVSLIPNVSYLDNTTNDMYQWDNVGDVCEMTYGAIKVMNRNHKSYFRNMWLKPKDDRVVNKLNLKSIYDKYDYLMDGDNYTSDNIGNIIETIRNSSKELKLSIVNKVKNLVAYGGITDVGVIRSLEKQFGIDLISFV